MFTVSSLCLKNKSEMLTTQSILIHFNRPQQVHTRFLYGFEHLKFRIELCIAGHNVLILLFAELLVHSLLGGPVRFLHLVQRGLLIVGLVALTLAEVGGVTVGKAAVHYQVCSIMET